MKREFLTGSISAVLLFFGFRAPAPISDSAPKQDKLVVAVVVTDPKCEQPNCQLAAQAMVEGVKAAYDSEAFKELQPFLKYQVFDDHGKPSKAEELASELQEHDDIIAVIGHSYSKTTSVAAPYYADAQIPLLIPVATSRTVGYSPPSTALQRIFGDHKSTRLQHQRNVFRLIPNDQIGQAPTIQYIIEGLKLGENGNVALMYDLDPSDNPQYMMDLRDDLLARMPSIPAREFKGGSECISENSAPGGVKMVVLISTAKTAPKFVKSDCFRQLADKGLRYLLLTDGAKNVDSETLDAAANHSVQVLLTFPTKQLQTSELNGLKKPYENLKVAFSPQRPQSYEEYGYSAMLLLSKALHSLLKQKTEITRTNVIEELSKINTMPGASDTIFIFDRGENVHPDYSIYVGEKADISTLNGPLCHGRFALRAVPPETHGHLTYLCFVKFDEAYLSTAANSGSMQ
jgi:ABC-type branched-subunit amino acid transport system substrate-binding protein